MLRYTSFIPMQKLTLPSLFLLEHPDKPLTRGHCENWFEVMVLGRLINRCIMTLPSVEVLWYVDYHL